MASTQKKQVGRPTFDHSFYPYHIFKALAVSSAQNDKTKHTRLCSCDDCHMVGKSSVLGKANKVESSCPTQRYSGPLIEQENKQTMGNRIHIPPVVALQSCSWS